MLKNVEDELKDTKLTIEQKNNQKKTLEAQRAKDPNNTALNNNLSNLTTEIRNLEIKEKALTETIIKIKAEGSRLISLQPSPFEYCKEWLCECFFRKLKSLHSFVLAIFLVFHLESDLSLPTADDSIRSYIAILYSL